ncbi:MAG: segregation/condensation protein A [Thermodesulfobacteriota bacterium]
MSLTVKLEIYEGPLDLLLHLIRKNEVDIYDIPIALITSQYLEYIDLMESLHLEVAGEFLLMAATLTQIKSKMLLPSLDEEGAEAGEEEDPRMAIVRPLLEHMKIKDAAESLERRLILDRDVFAREPDSSLLGLEPEDEDLIEASLFDLIDAFKRLVTRFEERAGLEIMVETKTIQQRIEEILIRLVQRREVAFLEVCAGDRTKGEFILTFLAVLELARVGRLRLFQHLVTREITLFYVEKPWYVNSTGTLEEVEPVDLDGPSAEGTAELPDDPGGEPEP